MTDELARRAPFFQHNRKLILDIEALEHRSRRPDVLVDEDLIHDFYDSLLPTRRWSTCAARALAARGGAGQPQAAVPGARAIDAP